MNLPAEMTPHDIATLVDSFYEKVRRHPDLGPVFNAAVHDWDDHKRTLTSFWCSVALKAATYRGNPMSAHRQHPIRAEHFAQWLALWRETTAEVLPVEAVAQMCLHADRIGRSLRYGLGLDEPARSRELELPVVASN